MRTAFERGRTLVAESCARPSAAVRSKYLEPWGLVRALESPETELFKIVRVLSAPLGLNRLGKKTQKERVGGIMYVSAPLRGTSRPGKLIA